MTNSPPRGTTAGERDHLREADLEALGIRLHPHEASPEDLERANAQEGNSGGRAYEPAGEAIRRMEATKGPTASRLLSWIFHPDERVPLHLMRSCRGHLDQGRWGLSVFYPILIERGIRDAQARGERWTPLLDAVGYGTVNQSHASDDYWLQMDSTLCHDPRGPFASRRWGQPIPKSWKTEELEAWDTHLASASPADAYIARAEDVASALREASEGEPERLHDVAASISPFVWTVYGRMHWKERGLKRSPKRDPELLRRLNPVLARGAADLSAFHDEPRQRGDPYEQASHLEAWSVVARESLRSLVPELLRSLNAHLDAPSETASHEGMIRLRRRSGAASHFGFFLSAAFRLRADLVREGKAPPGVDSPEAARDLPAHGSPLLMEGVLDEETIEEMVLTVTRTLPEAEAVDPEVRGALLGGQRALLQVLHSLGRDVSERQLLTLLDHYVGGDIRRMASRIAIEHEARTPEVLHRVYERERTLPIRRTIAEDPLVLENEDLFARLLESRAEGVQRNLFGLLGRSSPTTEQLLRAFRAFARTNPNLALSLLETFPDLPRHMEGRDVARLLRSDDPEIREEAVACIGRMGEASVEPGIPSPSHRPDEGQRSQGARLP